MTPDRPAPRRPARSHVFSDTGPQPDGTRTADQWVAAIREDMSIITRNVKWAMDDSSRGRCDPAPCIAVALKEARRLQSDLYRFADEALGITRDEIDQIGPQIGPL